MGRPLVRDDTACVWWDGRTASVGCPVDSQTMGWAVGMLTNNKVAGLRLNDFSAKVIADWVENQWTGIWSKIDLG